MIGGEKFSRVVLRIYILYTVTKHTIRLLDHNTQLMLLHAAIVVYMVNSN